ncbi:uncharacterized protein MELLADRAFT_86270 [Melampsora larici-populina 98AG31]|uniref:Uncharacterized protein n=1 Tax=Melampsora larici-populina (strain 98AG31 / pathotype 3-4-7) TaxID=747676 RepID=F4RL55_MELLP|nr:uncharacterized protein MELLADRAFT_86270 [Melampsora larici-populina 98AG31]EGG06924.1 hypothetical protein MELLADRAFT_86270 [Melampsora larici-populina 98AG31]
MSKPASKNEIRTPSHTVRVGFTGEAGAEAFARLNGAKGFISHHTSIATSGMNGGAPFENPIQITSYGSQADTLIPRNVYSMNCKLIGTNNNTDDQLHFENINRINLGNIDRFGEFFVGDLIDKIPMIALGIVYGRDLIQDPAHNGKSTVVITLKHTDYDPLTRGHVSWFTKHFIPPARNMEKAQNLCQLGRELQLTGHIRDYDADLFMWENEVTAISVCYGEVQLNLPSPARGAGGPNGGRVPLSLTSASQVTAVNVSKPSSENEVPLFNGDVDPADVADEGEEGSEPLAEMSNKSLGKRPRRG